MTLLEAITNKSQEKARAVITAGDEVLLTLTSRYIPFNAKLVRVTKATDKCLTVGAIRFYRSGRQVGERKSQPVHYGLYAITPEVEKAMEKYIK